METVIRIFHNLSFIAACLLILTCTCSILYLILENFNRDNFRNKFKRDFNFQDTWKTVIFISGCFFIFFSLLVLFTTDEKKIVDFVFSLGGLSSLIAPTLFALFYFNPFFSIKKKFDERKNKANLPKAKVINSDE